MPKYKIRKFNLLKGTKKILINQSKIMKGTERTTERVLRRL